MKSPKLTDEVHLAQLAEIGLGRAALMHEMRQPMAAIKLTLRLALKETQNPEVTGYLKDAIGQVDRLSELLDRNQDFMRPGQDAIEEFDLEPVVRRVLRLLEHSLRRKNIDVVIQIEDDIPPVKAAISRVEQILFNLINNARDGLVEEGQPGRLALLIRQQKEGVELIVADDGVGIPEDYRTSIFAPYTTTKGSGGTGMGLYVASKLATSFGGELVLLDHEETERLLDPPVVTAMMLRLPASSHQRHTLDELVPEKEVKQEVTTTLVTLSEHTSHAAIYCTEGWIRRTVVQTLQNLGVEAELLKKPRAISYKEADLIVVEVPEEQLEEVLPPLLGQSEAPPVLVLLNNWTAAAAGKALAMGCFNAIKVPTGTASTLSLQAAILAALGEQRVQTAALQLVQEWSSDWEQLVTVSPADEAQTAFEKLARVVAEEGSVPAEVACCCSDELAAQIEKIFGGCRRLKPDQRPPSSLDLLFLEPTEETPLTHLLDTMQLDDPMAMIICAERLSLREWHHAVDRGAVQIMTEISSAPTVAQERLSALARRLQSRKRLSVALKMLIRVPLDVREAAGQIRRRRILLVEDEAVMLKVMISILKPHGYQLFGCSTGEEAIHLLEKERIDLVIADKNLPDISGLDVVRASKERYPWSSALIITGYASQASAEEAMQLGAADYLIKPFDLNELVSRVQDALAMQRASRSAGTAERPRGVVLADPDPQVQQSLEEVFSQRDDPIIGKGAPSEALKLLSEQQVGVVVVSVDQDLSEREREYLERARDACPQMVVLATSSSPGLGRTVEALRLGARALLRTPFSDISRLTEAVKEACGKEQD